MSTPRITIMMGSSSAVEGAHRRVHLVVVEVGDLGQHGVQRSRLLTHGDHLDDHGGEHSGGPKRLGQRLAGGHRGPALHHRSFDHAIAGGARGDPEAFEDGHAGRDEGAQGTREAGHRDLADQGPDDGQLEEQGVDGRAAFFRPVVGAEGKDAPNDSRKDEQDIASHEVGEPDHDLGGKRQLGPQVLEHLGEGGMTKVSMNTTTRKATPMMLAG
jgi:hypothetical protein